MVDQDRQRPLSREILADDVVRDPVRVVEAWERVRLTPEDQDSALLDVEVSAHGEVRPAERCIQISARLNGEVLEHRDRSRVDGAGTRDDQG